MSDANEVRVLRMNQLSSTRYDDVPLPVRQQLGDFDDIVDVDARSGNGIKDYDLRVDEQGQDYDGLDLERTGTRVLGVTYHLDTTDAPAQGRADAPGSETYARHQAKTRTLQEDFGDQPQKGVLLSTQGNASLATQTDSEYISTQREIPGRNERYAHAVGLDDESGASRVAGSGGAAFVIPSQTAAEVNGETSNSGDDVPSGNIASVKSWVGDDKDRAQKARDAEARREQPRSSLVDWLDERING